MSDRETAEGNLVDQTREEHRSCMQLVAEVEQVLDRRPDDPESWLTDLKDRLAHLREELKEHFEVESAGPMFRALPISHPRLALRLSQLESEHPLMLENLDDLLAKARALKQPEVFQLRELNGLTQWFAARIRRHEAAEYELVIEAHWDDVGTGD
jgi:hypothetical protein